MIEPVKLTNLQATVLFLVASVEAWDWVPQDVRIAQWPLTDVLAGALAAGVAVMCLGWAIKHFARWLGSQP